MCAGSWRCHSDVIIVWNEPRWQGASDVKHRKRAEVCVRIWREKESGTRRQTRRIDFWSSQAWGELAPYGGPLEMGAKLIKRFRTWTRSRYVFSNSEIPMFYRYEHYMSISHIELIVNMVQYPFIVITPRFTLWVK